MSRLRVVLKIAFQARQYARILDLCLLFLALSAPVIAQAERPLTWQQDLNYLANVSADNPAELSPRPAPATRPERRVRVVIEISIRQAE